MAWIELTGLFKKIFVYEESSHRKFTARNASWKRKYAAFCSTLYYSETQWGNKY